VWHVSDSTSTKFLLKLQFINIGGTSNADSAVSDLRIVKNTLVDATKIGRLHYIRSALLLDVGIVFNSEAEVDFVEPNAGELLGADDCRQREQCALGNRNHPVAAEVPSSTRAESPGGVRVCLFEQVWHGGAIGIYSPLEACMVLGAWRRLTEIGREGDVEQTMELGHIDFMDRLGEMQYPD
jgi:hypothetical protein